MTDQQQPSFALPRQAQAGDDPGQASTPGVIETATPALARALAELEADIAAERVTRADANARARALTGARHPDTVDLPEYRIWEQANTVAKAAR